MRQAILRFLGVFAVLLGGRIAVAEAAGSVLADGTVRFKVGASDLTEDSERVLDRLAALLKRRRDLDPIELVGHADDRGAEATNRALSKQRAEAVKRALVKRGIAARRILVRGEGSTHPVSTEATEAARQLNRRVEVWVTPQRPVAEVTRVRRIVRAREAAAPSWQAAKVGLPLRRLARVRTGARSASEVEFRPHARPSPAGPNDRVQLGPEALVVIYDAPRAGRDPKAEVEDVAVESGTIFAAMAAKDRALRVRTKPSRVRVRSRRTRIDVRRAVKAKAKAQQVSTISVFEGRSDVAAQGAEVSVREGFGTRVEEGKKPEPPRPLPVAPAWVTKDPYVTYAGRPLDLEWTKVPGVEAVEVQLGGAEDTKVELPEQMWRVKGERTRGGSAQVGLHHLRLVGVDARDVSGAPGRTLRLLALPEPADAKGRALSAPGGRLRVRTPGELRWPSGGPLVVSSTTSSTTPLRATLVRPGAHHLPVVVHVGGISMQRELLAWVDTATLTADVSAPEAVDGAVRAEVTFSVATEAGGVDGLEWVGAVVSMPTTRLATSAGEPAPLVDCRCGRPLAATAAEPLGEGRYRWVLDLPRPALTSSVTVRLFEPGGRLAVELPVSVRVPRGAEGGGAEARHRTRSGYFGGLRLGALVSHSDAPTAELSGELGYRIGMRGGLELDLSLEAGWLHRDISGSVDVVPILGRIGFGLDLGAPRLYAGGGAGARVVTQGGDVGGAAIGFAGVGYRFGHSEVLLEGAYRYFGQAPGTDEGLAGLAVVVGYRWGSFDWP